MALADQALGQLVYVILHATKIGIEEVADHEDAVPVLPCHRAAPPPPSPRLIHIAKRKRR